ncbi:hypothetical protein L6Q21_17805 [Sandaracinobacter sp. RS1-74]|uniref:hypothetical protein n=1 Tax=Sandaracinobacteroides sayramensis TaxID=2913411 RepID=UPI001EDA841C|nr:hypothetical protein [Sandaracinobacteroides sayramensis]MCG2842835.1 hypothetical protein [Sandaracinobacteroides sayramensis]
MRQKPESRLLLAAPLAGIALLWAGSALATPATKARPQAQVTAEGEVVGFRVKSQQLAITPINLDVSKFAFTAPGRVASSRVQTVERGFSFTPSRAAKNGVSLGMTTRAVTTPAPERTAAIDSGIQPSGYNFDLSVGYKGFAVSGGMSRVDSGLGGQSREGVDVGLGYGTRTWRAGVQATAERETGYMMPRAANPDPLYSVEARGALALSPQISLGGSLRYRQAPQHPTPLDPNKDDRAVMLGGAVAF